MKRGDPDHPADCLCPHCWAVRQMFSRPTLLHPAPTRSRADLSNRRLRCAAVLAAAIALLITLAALAGNGR